MLDLFHHSARSPLIYPGSKSRALHHIVPLFPKGLTTLASPFLGGGALEIACASMGMRVHASDAQEPLINFWRHALRDAGSIADAASLYIPMTQKRYGELYRGFPDMDDDFERAVVFYVINRSSFSGKTLASSSMGNGKEFNPRCIQRLRSFASPRLHVECMDYRAALDAHRDEFLYLDPPYPVDTPNYYGWNGSLHRGFDHAELARILRQRDGWVLSYNNVPLIRELYEGCEMRFPEWNQSMSNKGTMESNELLVLNI